MSKKVIIVGGVAGGASAAARLRRMDENMKIIMFERGEHISFANCGLPYYIGEVIKERDALLVQTIAGMSERFNIDIRNFSEVTKIDRHKKVISVKNINTGESYDETYDYLLLSPGASPIKPPIPGIEKADNLFTLRTIPDTDAIKKYVDNENPATAVVIGGGFIGIEMAENLHLRNLDVTIVEMADQIMAPLDMEMASILHAHIRSKGINLILSDGVKSFEENGRKILLQSGKELAADLIIFAIGVKPENNLAKDSGLELGERGGIKVNEFLQTSDPSIYAVGDAIEVVDYLNRTPAMIPLAGPANKQGRIAANNICGGKEKYPGTLGTAVAKVFDMTVATTGNNEKTLKRLGEEYQAIHIHPLSHAGYYPAAFPLNIKMLFDKENNKILGAQATGFNGVEKRIDVIATAIKGDMPATGLAELELSYAPPFSSAKDPVNMLGFYAENTINGLVENFQWDEVEELKKNGAFFLDVRDEIEIDLGTIDGSLNIPLPQLRKRLGEIAKNNCVYVFCQVGLRGYIAARILKQHGYTVKNLDGGFKTYQCVYAPGSQDECLLPASEAGKAIPTSADQGEITAQIVVDACGLQCPGPIMKVFKTIQTMQPGEVLEIRATDPGFSSDIGAWCAKTGNTLVDTSFDGQAFIAKIRKGGEAEMQTLTQTSSKKNATLVVFSQDLDKALAAFIIASGAAAMGKKVTLFFTFWGLNILRKQKSPPVEKDFLAKMFGMMMPQGTKKLPISNMNMAGMGPKMIQFIMKQKNVDSLESLMAGAMEVGVNLVACAMSMDIMGIKQEELIDGVEIGGVGSYLGEAEDSGLNLFI